MKDNSTYHCCVSAHTTEVLYVNLTAVSSNVVLVSMNYTTEDGVRFVFVVVVVFVFGC